MNVPQERYDAVMRLREAADELQKARVKEASDVAAKPEMEAALQRRNDAIVDLGRMDVYPPELAKHAGILVEEALSVLYEAGLAPEYEPVAEQDVTIRRPH